MPTLVVDPWHWLTEDGAFIVDNLSLYRRMLRIAGRWRQATSRLGPHRSERRQGPWTWTRLPWRDRQ
jgi:hypothetical protein